MDNLLLEAAVGELRAIAIGFPLHRIVPDGPDRLTLLLGDGWGESAGDRCRIFLSVEPALAILHLAHGRAPSPSPPTPFQGLLARELDGARLAAIPKGRWERWGALAFEVAGTSGPRSRRLAFELFGARANLLLLGEDDRILGFHHEPGGERAQTVGAGYRPPAAGDRLDPETVGRAAWEAILAEGAEGLGRRLGRRLQGMSPAILDDLERRARAGEETWEPFRQWVERAAAGRFEVRGYARPEPEPGRIVRVAPFPIAPAEGLREVRFAGAGEALQALREGREADRSLAALRASLAREIDREVARLARLEAGLAEDLAREGEADELQRQGTILLAGLAGARAEGETVTLPDPFDAAAGSITLRIDPRLSLRENADRLFHKARKSRRGRETVARRLDEVRGRLPRLREAAGLAAAAGSAEELAALEARLGREGILRLVRRAAPKRAAAASRSAPQVLPVRSHTSADGLEILIGKGGRENDLLTFKIASPHDFWLHASGHAGAHVVVRNPERLKRLPRATLQQAARLAAFHSKARGAGQVDVLVTLRRNVKKGRGLPPGMVRVGRHETVQAPPTNPFEAEV